MTTSMASALNIGPMRPAKREIRDFLEACKDAGSLCDASYGESLRALLPRRLDGLLKRRWRR